MIGGNIKKIRLERGLSLNETARKAGVAPAYLSTLETGKKTNPSLDVLKKIAEVLAVNPNDLLNENYDDEFSDYELNKLVELAKKASPAVRKKMLKIIEMFEEENGPL